MLDQTLPRPTILQSDIALVKRGLIADMNCVAITSDPSPVLSTSTDFVLKPGPLQEP